MPRGQHMPGVSPKANRMYSHVLAGYRKAGKGLAWSKQMAARTVNAWRSRTGQVRGNH